METQNGYGSSTGFSITILLGSQLRPMHQKKEWEPFCNKRADL